MTATPTGTRPYVFLSYAAADRERALRIADALEAAGVPVWVDRRSIAGGNNWTAAIVQGIKGSGALVLAATAAAVARRNVQRELQLAVEFDRPVLPLLLERVQFPDVMRFALAGVQWLEVLDRPAEEWQPDVLRALAGLGVTAAEAVATAPVPSPVTSDMTTPRSNLPAALTSLVGREQEIAEITRLLETARLVTLTGPGGVGKTRLALAAGHVAAPRFSDGAWFVDLSPVADPALVASSINRALGVPESAGHTPSSALQTYLREKHLLLILDNLEQIVEAASLIHDLLVAAPALTILATSRMLLRIGGEREIAIPPLPVPDPVHPSDPEILIAVPSVALFVARAQDADPTFVLNEENAAAVVEICARLDGLPLALELAAARLRILSPESLRGRLEHRLSVLTSGARDAPRRQQTLRDTLAWSHDLLAPAEQTLFRRLAVFAGGFTVEAVEAVCGSVEGSPETLDGVASLVEQSLLKREAGPDGEPRFRMLETVREYAADRLDQSLDAEATRARHTAYFLLLAEQAQTELRGPAQAGWLARLEAEYDNIRAALGWALATGEVAVGVRIGVALARFFERHGYAAEGRRWLERLLATGANVPLDLRAKAIHAAGTLALTQGDYPAARGSLTECLALQEELGDPRNIAVTLNGLGNIAYQQGDFSEARRCYGQSLALLRELGDRWRMGIALNNLANVASAEGDFAGARARYEEGLALARSLGDAILIADILQNLGELVHRQGDDTAAQSFYESALSQQRALGDKRAMGVTLCNLGELALQRGDTAAARALLEESLTLRRGLGDKRGVGLTLNAFAAIARREGDLAEAAGLLCESLTLRREIGDRPGIADSLVQCALIASAQGDHETGVRLLGAAETLRDALGSPLSASSRAEHDREVAIQRATLGETTFTALWAEGRATSLEDAVLLALTPFSAEAPVTPAAISAVAAAPGPRPARPSGLIARS